MGWAIKYKHHNNITHISLELKHGREQTVSNWLHLLCNMEHCECLYKRECHGQSRSRALFSLDPGVV